MDPAIITDRIAQVNEAYKTLNSYGVKAVGGGHAVYLAANQIFPGIKDTSCSAELLQAVNHPSFGLRGAGLGNIVYGKWGIGENGIYSLISKPEMDSMRYAIPRFTYPNRVINFMFSLFGQAYQNGNYGGVSNGLYPNNYQANRFFHFGGKFSLENPAEFERLVGKNQELVRGVFGI